MKNYGVVWIVAAVSVSAVCLAAWVTRPLPRRARTFTLNGYRYQVETERHYEFLPVREWGVLPSELVGCGPNGGFTEKQHNLGFVAVVDSKSTFFQKVK